MDAQPASAGFASDFTLPAYTNPPQQFFGTSQDTSPLIPDFGFSEEYEDGLFDDIGHGVEHEGKRRRIAKVRHVLLSRLTSALTAYRHVICVERRRSSATEECPPARIASITRPSVYSRTSRRSGILQKGKSSP